jgi:hypothetical protein
VLCDRAEHFLADLVQVGTVSTQIFIETLDVLILLCRQPAIAIAITI